MAKNKSTFSLFCVRCVERLWSKSEEVMLFVGAVFLISGLLLVSNVASAQSVLYPADYWFPTFSWASPDYDDTQIRYAVGLIFKLLEGAFGALIMVVAGLMAIIAAVMGGYKSALGMLVVAVGAFIMRSLVSLFF